MGGSEVGGLATPQMSACERCGHSRVCAGLSREQRHHQCHGRASFGVQPNTDVCQHHASQSDGLGAQPCRTYLRFPLCRLSYGSPAIAGYEIARPLACRSAQVTQSVGCTKMPEQQNEAGTSLSWEYRVSVRRTVENPRVGFVPGNGLPGLLAST
jgi:hypothetical protein